MAENPAAFPAPEQRTQYEDKLLHPRQPGMSLRDWFAGQALPGIITCQVYLPDAVVDRLDATGRTLRGEAAKAAYEMADAMLAERGRK